MKINRLLALSLLLLLTVACNKNESDKIAENLSSQLEDEIEFGYNLNNFIVIRDTIRSGDSFGEILERNNPYAKYYNEI